MTKSRLKITRGRERWGAVLKINDSERGERVRGWGGVNNERVRERERERERESVCV